MKEDTGIRNRSKRLKSINFKQNEDNIAKLNLEGYVIMKLFASLLRLDSFAWNLET